MALYLTPAMMTVSGAPSGSKDQVFELPGTPVSQPQVALQSFQLSYGGNDEKQLHSIEVDCSVIGWNGNDVTVRVTAGMRDDGQGNTVTSNIGFLIIADIR